MAFLMHLMRPWESKERSGYVRARANGESAFVSFPEPTQTESKVTCVLFGYCVLVLTVNVVYTFLFA